MRFLALRSSSTRHWPCAVGLLIALCAVANAGELELNVVDAADGSRIGARVEITDARGRPRHIRKSAALADHFSVYGPTVLPLNGKISYVIRSGPEYLEESGSFMMKREATDNHTVQLKRFADMKSKGWWSGDPWAQRAPVDAALLLAAEDLHLLGIPQLADSTSEAPDPTTTPNNRVADFAGQAYVTTGGRVHIWHTNDDAPRVAGIPLDLATDNDHVEIASPGSWDLPLWLATGRVDSYQLHHPPKRKKKARSSDDLPTERPIDTDRFSDDYGVGRYHELIYHHMLKAGLKIAPTATSASGITNEAPGTYRTYVNLDGEFSRDAWWEGVRAGRVMFTNGPLIIPAVNGKAPGHVFRADAGETVSLTPRLTLHAREKVNYLEFIKDGKSVEEIRLDDWVKAKGKLPPMEFSESGWFIIRAVTNVGETYRYASTAPYYIEIGEQPRISRESAQYFLDWVHDRAKHLKTTNDPHREALLPHLRTARDFWQERVDNANAP